MKNNLRYFVATIVLMMVGMIPSYAVVVFDAKTDNISGKNSITKDGITISTTNGNSWSSNGGFNGELSITSSDRNIVMVGLRQYDYTTWGAEASNTYECEQDTMMEKRISSPKRTDDLGSWETIFFNGHFSGDYHCYYKVWKGKCSELICPIVYNLEYIYVYFDGDDLPQKRTFALYDHFDSGYDPIEDNFVIYYGYLDFLPIENYYYYDGRVKRCSFPINGSDFEWIGESNYFDEIIFDESFSEYKPKSTNKWFKGIDYKEILFTNLDLSEVEDMSYMFENCKNKVFDLSEFSFSNHPKVTGMLSGSDIKYLTVSESIVEADDDIFVGLGSGSNPCYLDAPDDIKNQITNENGNVFVWKGGAFILPVIEPYVSREICNDYWSDYLDYSTRVICYTFRYDDKRQYYKNAHECGAWYIDETTSIDYDYSRNAWKYFFERDYYDYRDLEWGGYFPILQISPSFVEYRPTSTAGWFRDCYYVDEIQGMKYLNTSEVTDMSGMFYGCYNLYSIDLSHFDTSKVTNMSGMFGMDYTGSYGYYFSGSSTRYGPFALDVSCFDTSNVSNMSYMFGGCRNLTNLDVSHFNTSNVTNMKEMFAYCSNITNLDLHNFDTSNVTDMSGIFTCCNNLTNIDLSNFNTSNVTNMSCMFGHFDPENRVYYNQMQSLDVSHFDMSKVTNSEYMFSGCSNLKQLHISSTMGNLSENACLNIGKENPCKLYAPDGFDYGVGALTKELKWKRGVFTLENINTYCYYVRSNDSSSNSSSLVLYCDDQFDNRQEEKGLFKNINDKLEFSTQLNNSITSIIIDSTFGGTNPEGLSFNDFNYLTSIEGLEYLNTSNFTNMSNMFVNCISLTSLDLSHFSTSNVIDMSNMFSGCIGLTSLNVSSFDTSKLAKGKSSKMFMNCCSLNEIAISATMGNLDNDAFNGVGTPENPCIIYAPVGFDFGIDTNQSYFVWKGGYFKANIETFATLSDDGKTLTFCYGIKPQNMSENVYAFNTADTNPAWYGQRTNITNVVFDPSFAYFKPTSTYAWFRGMENLEEIEGLEYLNTSETTLMSYMFYGCSKLKSIDVSHFDTKNVEKMGYMFQNCTSLESIDISNFDYSANTSCYRMFNGCTNLKSINTGEWRNNTNDQFGYLFAGCSSLESLDLSQLVLPSEAKTTSMLNGCKALRQLTISPSMSVLNSAACSGVGTADNPCDITAPDDFDFGVDTSAEPFRWKSGYFRLASKLLAEASDVKYGNVYDLKISLLNGSHVYNGYQFNIHLPAGFDLTQKPRAGYEYTLSNRYANTPTIRITPQNDGSYQVLAYSVDDATITGTEGLIITLPLIVEDGLSEGTYSGSVTDITFNNPDNTSSYLQDVAFDIFVPAFGMGDVNHDRAINITDVMMTVNHVVGQTPSGFHVEDADVNGDNVVNISDIMAIVNLLVSAPTANAPANVREAMTDAISLTPTPQGYAVALKNNEPYTALQMDIQLPSDAPLNARLMDNRSDGHSIICHDLGNGHYRLAIYSLNGHTLRGNDGILLQLQTNNNHDALPEIYDVQLTNRLFESVTLSDISFPTDITNVDTDATPDAPAYNTQGIRATKHHRGILIQNGRKQVRK